MRLEQRAVFCRSLQVSVSRLSPRPPYKWETANSSRVSGFFVPCVPKVFDFLYKNGGRKTGFFEPYFVSKAKISYIIVTVNNM